MTTIAILEQISDIEEYHKLQNEYDDLIAVVTTPQVCWELTKKGIPYKPIETIYDSERVFNHNMDNFSKIDSLCSTIDDYLKTENFLLQKYNISPAYDNFFFIKMLYDALSVRIAILHDLIETIQPERIIGFSHNDSTTHNKIKRYPFDPKESIFSIVLQLDGWKIPTQVIIKTPESSITSGYHSISSIDDIIKKYLSHFRINIFIYNILYSLKKNGLRSALRAIIQPICSLLKHKKYLIKVGFGYNWETCIPHVSNIGYEIFHYSIKPITSIDENVTVQFPISFVNEWCNSFGIDFTGVFLERLIPKLRESLSCLSDNIEEVEKLIRFLNPQAILYGIKTSFTDHLFAHVAHYHNVINISWQHGSQGMSHNPIAYPVEMMNSDVHLTYGKCVSDTYREIIKIFPNRFIQGYYPKFFSTGSQNLFILYQKRIRRAINKNDVVYITTNYYLNNFYINLPILFQDNSLWLTQQKILATLGECGVNSFFKLHPSNFSDNHFHEYLFKCEYDTIEIIRGEKSISDLIENCDVIIIDCPTTTLLEALTTEKNIFVLLKHFPLTDIAESLLRKRAYCSSDIDEFSDMIHAYLTGCPIAQKPDVNNTEYLEAYGLFTLDRSVTERVIEVLDSVTNKINRK